MSGTLYIVATPIGNLEDTSQRAVRTLREVDLIACEDTRHTRKLLNHFGIDTKTTSYHEHNERERAAELRQVLENGKDVALVSDAGTPLMSDPGFRIVQTAIDGKIPIVSIPGPVASVTALAGSGLTTNEFFFAGFLPSRGAARRAKLFQLRDLSATLVFYEAPHRIAKTLHDALDVLGDRDAVLARELTKVHEEFVRGKLRELSAQFSEAGAIRGEIVLMICGSSKPTGRVSGKGCAPSVREGASALAARVHELEQEGLTSKEALKRAARELGLKRAEAYRLLLAHKNRLSK